MWFRTPIIQGEGKARTLGYPTINLKIPRSMGQWSLGIYTTKARVGRREWNGVLYWGTKGGREPSLEINLFDLRSNVASPVMEFQVGEFVRADHKFESEDVLKAQIAEDVVKVKGMMAKAVANVKS